MDLNLLYILFLIIPIVWWIINYCLKLKIYRQLYDLESSIKDELDFTRLSKHILQRVNKVTSTSAGIIYWFDEVQNKFKLKSFHGIPADKLNRITRSLASGLSELIDNSQPELMLEDKKIYSLINGIESREPSRLYSGILALPLNTSKRTVGIIFLFKSSANFSKREQFLLKFFAQRIAIKLDHSRLYQLATDTALENAKLYVNISKLYHKAILDSLTGLYNRHFLMQKLKEEIKKSYRFRQTLSLIFTDIDLFKRVNDEFGHSTGDQVLIEFANLLKKSIREYDLACRFGGEEFVILLPLTDLSSAKLLAERLREKTAANLFCTKNNRIRLTASFGVSSLGNFIQDLHGNLSDETLNTNAENLLAWADDALYRAKKAGRNRVLVYEASENHKINGYLGNYR